MYRIGKEELNEIARVVESRQLFRVGDPAMGHLGMVDQFEKEWSEKIGVEYTLCMSGGGTGALLCSLVGLGIGPGDEVIVPGYTFMASAVAVLAAGAIPVIADVDESLGIDPDHVESLVGPNTKAIMVVHMMGRPCDMDRIMDIAKRYDLKVVEDVCQADGGSYKGKRLGSYGHASGFSFNHYKIISCGDGGAMVTNDRTAYERALVFHDGGAAFRPHAKDLAIPVFTGIQLRASEIMGAVLRAQCRRLDGILSDLRRFRRMLEAELAGKPGIRIAPSNDPDGDCGVVVALSFDTESEARAFASASGVGGGLPIDSDRHVYCNWEPVLAKQAGSHPALNPFLLPQNQGLRMDYSKDMLPRTLDILSRTVLVGIDPDWTEDAAQAKIDACAKAAAAL